MALRKLLMLTNSELGQANVFISTAQALLELDPTVEIHLASFPNLGKTIKESLSANGSRIKFHPLPGRPQFECFNDEKVDAADRLFAVSQLKPGAWNAPTVIRFIMTKAFICWAPEEFAEIFGNICALIESLQPDGVILDQLFAPGITAANFKKTQVAKPYPLIVLSPNSIKDFIYHLEPGAAPLWKWPVIGSGLPYPIPWSLIPLNVYLGLRLIGILATDSNMSLMKEKVRECTKIPNLDLVDCFSLLNSNLHCIDKVIIGCRSEIDFPGLNITGTPKDYMNKIVGVGPILRPLEKVDGELAVWLARGPVVYINLGTHCLTSEAEAAEMARSLKTVLQMRSNGEKTPRLQVLWKLKKDLLRSGDFSIGPGSVLYKILGDEINADRVRIVHWLSSEPSSILDSGHVVCSVNHGGANSFYEAVCSGVPQIILPSWLDCYDYANRVENLGIGRWGSKQGCPRWIEAEFKLALIDVIFEKNAVYAANSKSLADICGRNERGRTAAAQEILKYTAA